MASLLGVLLVACGASRPLAPTTPEDLTRSVLSLQDMPDGRVIHTWRRAEKADVLLAYRSLSHRPVVNGPIVLAMGPQRDCDEENRECIRRCMSRPLDKGFGHITSGGRGRGGKEAYCNEQCMQPYLDCTELQERHPREFTSVEGALDWLKRHRHSILVGSLVVVAGVVFVVASAGAGIVVLLPAALVAAPSLDIEPFLAETLP